MIFDNGMVRTTGRLTLHSSATELIVIAASNGIIYQIDINTAFLKATLNENIYMLSPEGLHIPEGKVLLLKESLYELKQSPRNFNKTLNKTIVNMCFARCMSDTCMYINNINGKDVYIAIYVDDIIIACVDESIIVSIKQQIAEKYTTKDMEVMDWYLGRRYITDSTTGIITLDQSKYTENILVKFKNLHIPQMTLQYHEQKNTKRHY